MSRIRLKTLALSIFALSAFASGTALAGGPSIPSEKFFEISVSALKLNMSVDDAADALKAAGFEDGGYVRIDGDQMEAFKNDANGQVVALRRYRDSDDVSKVDRILFQQAFSKPQPLDRTRSAVVARYGEPTRSGERTLVYNAPFRLDHAYTDACEAKRKGPGMNCLERFADDQRKLGMSYDEMAHLHFVEEQMPSLKAKMNERTVQINLQRPGAADAAREREKARERAEAEAEAKAEKEALAVSKPVKMGF